MILEGFEIENWSCIRKVSVSGLPTSGVVVFHGPNRTGKSSIVQALRACLMDYSSSTAAAALKSYFPRGTAEKPVASVTFRVGNTSYRIRKHFGTSKSEFSSQTSTGDWKVETTSATDAHDRTCALAGGSDSAKGLHQLLWLTQAEFRLPDAKKFDAGVQAQLRGILGVLQTPLDDRFIEQVKKRWNTWYSGQRKSGKQHEIKPGCNLAENRNKLIVARHELQESEGRFIEVERLLQQAANLEQAALDFNDQLQNQTRELTERQEEHQRSQTRILARRQAEKDHAAAEKERTAALEEQQQRDDTTKRWRADADAVVPAQKQAEACGQSVEKLERKQTQDRNALSRQRDTRRELQNRASSVSEKLKELDDVESLTVAQEVLKHATDIAKAIAAIEEFLNQNPAPDKSSLDALKVNRQQAVGLRAERDAASMNLIIVPLVGAGAAQLGLDGGPLQELPTAAGAAIHTVRRKAELHIPDWGRIEFSRGSGQGNLDQIEDELRRYDEEFSSALAPFGIAGYDPNALDQLVDRAAQHRLKTWELSSKQKELKQVAPKGLEPLQAKANALQTKLKDVPRGDSRGAELLPAERSDLERLAGSLKQQSDDADNGIKQLEQADSDVQDKLKDARQEEMTTKETLAGCKAKAKGSSEELDRLRSDEQIATRIADANRAIENAKSQLHVTALTSIELTINERLLAAQRAVESLQRQIADNTRKLDVIKGRLIESEGLHARRASLAARVDELTHVTDRESLEKDAVDRLYALFEECREKQLGTLMDPIHDRVLGWMRVLDIGDYKQVRFNDAFLPDKLMSRDGTAEFTVAEESTGAQEQIGMLVRLALGSVLASVSEPALAILDDPLTHCDSGRLNKMRVILRRAAEGDPQLTPAAGPLQIVIFTCHPEWFRDDRATVIDLESSEVMSRFAV